MQDPYVDTQNSLPYQPVSMPDQTLPQRAPGQFQTDPNLPPVNPRRSGSRVRTGAIIALTLVLVLVFGVGLFAGWQFGRSGTSTATGNSSTGTLQTGAAPAVTVPPLSGNNIDTVREAVIAKVRPSVVEVNVSIPGGSGIGSGVIVDRRGDIVPHKQLSAKAPKQNARRENRPQWRNHTV